jgi:hypothetical protein
MSNMPRLEMGAALAKVSSTYPFERRTVLPGSPAAAFRARLFHARTRFAPSGGGR